MRKLIALLFTIVLAIPLILTSLLLININTSAIDRNFYIQALDTDKVYMAILSDETIDSILVERVPFLSLEGNFQIRELVRSIFTREYLNDQISNFINDLFDYLQGKTDIFEPVINISNLKTTLAGEKSPELLSAIIAALPECEPGVLPGIDTAIQKACKPSGMNDEVLASVFLQPALPLLIAQIPDEVPIGENWEEIIASRKWGPFTSGKTLPAGLLLATVITGFVTLSFWYIAALIADDSWRIRMQWLGWTLLIPSALLFFVSLASTADISTYWVNFGIDHINLTNLPIPAGFALPLREIVRSVFMQMTNSFLMIGSICGAFGLGLIFWGLALPRKNHN